LVTARRTFDIAHAWGGKHPMNVPIVVLTHHIPQEWVDKPGSPFTFVTDGVESAIEKAWQIAREKNIVVGAPSVMKQCLQVGLMDEIHKKPRRDCRREPAGECEHGEAVLKTLAQPASFVVHLFYFQ
jgi:hypothetical protein